MFGFPNEQVAQTWAIGPTGVLGAADFQAWTVPRNYSMLNILLIGGGGGGGGAGGSAAGVGTRGGGAGGAGGAITVATFPIAMLPDELYFVVGYGGAAGLGANMAGAPGNVGTAGGNGRTTRVSVYSLGIPETFLLLALAGVGGGPGDDAGTAGGAQLGGAAMLDADALLSCWSVWRSRIGQPSQAGNIGAADVGAFAPALTTTALAGCGGAGCVATARAGGFYAATANSPYLGSIAGPAGSLGHGQPGFRWGKLPYMYGGTGGGSSNTGTGGNGGDCNSQTPGCGGGGGGAGLNTGGNTAGRGGVGGPGLALLTAF